MGRGRCCRRPRCRASSDRRCPGRGGAGCPLTGLQYRCTSQMTRSSPMAPAGVDACTVRTAPQHDSSPVPAREARRAGSGRVPAPARLARDTRPYAAPRHAGAMYSTRRAAPAASRTPSPCPRGLRLPCPCRRAQGSTISPCRSNLSVSLTQLADTIQVGKQKIKNSETLTG